MMAFLRTDTKKCE